MILAALLVLAGPPQGPAPGVGDAPAADPSSYETTVMAEGLDRPWDVTFLTDGPGAGDVLVTERSGALRVLRDGVMLEAPIAGVPTVFAEGQGGLFEALPHPGFAANGLLYLSYASGVPGDNTLALARGRYVPTEDGARLEGVETLFEALPRRTTDAHYGGRMTWLGDGTLLLTSGEGYGYRHDAQDLSSHMGKVLRLDEDGGAPADNPFVGRKDAAAEVYSYGHRNPQGIVRVGGVVYEDEHGPMGGDEVNVLTPGANYGWPVASYGLDYSGAAITPFATWEGSEQPLFQWTPSIAPAALTHYDGAMFPRWRGKLMAPALAHRHVRLFDPQDPGDQTELFGELEARVRDVAVAPDGAVWLALERGEDGGQLVRVTPR